MKFVLYISPGLERIGLSLAQELLRKDLGFWVVAPLFEYLSLSKRQKNEIRPYLFNQLVSDHSQLLEGLPSKALYADRLILNAPCKKEADKYVEMILSNYFGLVQASNSEEVIVILEPQNDFFSFLCSLNSSLKTVYYKRAKLRGRSNLIWISSELNEIPEDVEHMRAIETLRQHFGFDYVSEYLNSEYWEDKAPTRNLHFFQDLLNIARSFKHYCRLTLIKSSFRKLMLNAAMQGIRRSLRKFTRFNKFDELHDINANYLILPLQVFPEASTLGSGIGYMLEFVRAVSIRLPIGVKLVVKEHPNDTGYRPKFHYQLMKQLPNVILVNPETNVSELISNAKCKGLVTHSSTMVEEAINANKHAFLFSHHSMFKNSKFVVLTNFEIIEQQVRMLLTQKSRLSVGKDELADIKSNYSKYILPADLNDGWPVIASILINYASVRYEK